MSETTFDRKRFQTLLKYGIGTRTQKEFASQVGMAPAYINRMLNDPKFPCPKQKTVEIIASHIKAFSETELLTACGYTADTIEERIQKVESDIQDYFAFGTASNCIFNSIIDLQDSLRSFLDKYSATLSVKHSKETIPSDMESKGAEDSYLVHVVWEYSTYRFITEFRIFFIETKSGKLILVGSDIDRATNTKHTKYSKIFNQSAEERLLHSIFESNKNKDGFEGETLIVSTAGYGFELDGTPLGFSEFLMEHSYTFCDSDENIALYNKFLASGNDESVFADYCVPDGDSGAGAVIADIMRKETGMSFTFYDKDPQVPESISNACVFLIAGTSNIMNIKSELLNLLYEYAVALKLKKFGAVYYKSALCITDYLVFDTDSYAKQ